MAISNARNRLRGLYDKEYRKNDKQAKIARWEEQKTTADLLTRLVCSKEWREAIKVLEKLKDDSDMLLHDISKDDRSRLIGTSQWCAYQAFVREIRVSIATGMEATKALDKVHSAPPETSDQRSQPV